jgi:hypothetical protein
MRLVDVSGPILLFLLSFAGVLGAYGLGKYLGCIGYVFGLSIGAGAMLAILYAGAVAWLLIRNLLFRGIPWLPWCRNGCCRGGILAHMGDYKPVWNDDGILRGFRCRCGIVYRKVGRHFVEIAPDGSFKPYRVWVPVKGWLPDHGEDV